MKVHYSIHYKTYDNQTVRLISVAADGEEFHYPMSTVDNEHWTCEVALSPTGLPFSYYYAVWTPTSEVRREWGKARVFAPYSTLMLHLVTDAWRELPADTTLYAAPFTQVYFPAEAIHLPESDQLVTIEATVPMPSPHHQVRLVGSTEAMGSWDIDNGHLMQVASYPRYCLTLDGVLLAESFDYKLVVIDTHTGILHWEEGENRRWESLPSLPQYHYHYHDLFFRSELPRWYGAGCAIPLFSLRSQRSAGIGDMADLKLMADWAAATGQSMIQILPINDTTMSHTWEDSYPYNSISTQALHPLYLAIDRMGALQDTSLSAEIERERKRLNDLESVDYQGVDSLKWRFIRAIYQQEGAAVLQSENFYTYFALNADWLPRYAAFSYLRDSYETPCFSCWGEWASYDANKVAHLVAPESDQYTHIALYYYLQYHLHLQLTEARLHAHRQGVALKGDIPIGISRNSVEAWSESELFDLESQVGAPPDSFSQKGQNWGFPAYRWEVMAADGYAWWARRFKQMARYFDAYRIDHILGFFRIWEIPTHSVEGLLGHFSPALPFATDELRARGCALTIERLVTPYIHRDMLPPLFGFCLHEADLYIEPCDEETYTLRSHCNTQRKVQTLFPDDDPRSITLRRALYELCNEVLCVPDPIDTARLHPRIALMDTASFRYLCSEDQAVLTQLHNDFYYERHNRFWEQEALRKLPPLIGSTDMLVCAEDLGMIPRSVPQVLSSLQVLTLEIQRMPKEPYTLFATPEGYPYHSVAATGTHDMSTLRGWWEEDHALITQYYHHLMHHPGEPPTEATGDACYQIIRSHLLSNSLFVILPWQDWLSIDEGLRTPCVSCERINEPANPRHYWRYRMHLTLEELLANQEYTHTLRALIAQKRA